MCDTSPLGIKPAAPNQRIEPISRLIRFEPGSPNSNRIESQVRDRRIEPILDLVIRVAIEPNRFEACRTDPELGSVRSGSIRFGGNTGIICPSQTIHYCRCIHSSQTSSIWILYSLHLLRYSQLLPFAHYGVTVIAICLVQLSIYIPLCFLHYKSVTVSSQFTVTPPLSPNQVCVVPR